MYVGSSIGLSAKGECGAARLHITVKQTTQCERDLCPLPNPTHVTLLALSLAERESGM